MTSYASLSKEHFQLLDNQVIGEGSFGKVFKCHWFGVLAAVKRFNVVQTNEIREIDKEIDILKDLQNNNIIQFFGIAQHNGNLCLVTSYAERGSLRDNLVRHKLSPAQKTTIISGIINGMLFLRNKCVVHRDLKSANVLLDVNYVAKICDFGLAVLKLNSSTQANTGKTLGTSRWLAPEALSIRPRYSFASDVYALGLVIWEIFTEKVPYENAATDSVILDAIRNGVCEEIPESVPEHYKHLIENCWHFEPERRITIAQLKHANDKAIPQIEFENDHMVFDQDISGSIMSLSISDTFRSEQSGSVVSEDTSMTALSETVSAHELSQLEQTSNNDIHLPAYFKSRQVLPKTELINTSSRYTRTVQQYIIDGASGLYNRDRLVSALDKHDVRFVQWIQMTAAQGQVASVTMLGEMYYHGCHVAQDHYTAAIHFKRSADQEYARAQCNLGTMYANGQGVLQSDETAVTWYMKAAGQGYANAQCNLAYMYVCGRGVTKNDEKAVDLYSKAAAQGNTEAQLNLGHMYEDGRGVSHSMEKAVEWYRKAAEQGDAEAQFNMGRVHKHGLSVQKSDDAAAKWYQKAAEQGHVDAQFNLGWLYRHGWGVDKSYNKAAEWYFKAAVQGHADAQFNLGRMHMDGRGVPLNNDRAVEWYTKAVAQGHTDAQCKMAFMYTFGRGVPQCDRKAVELYTMAAEEGHTVAQFNLGFIYQHGLGVPQSDLKAAEWYTKAAEQGHAAAQLNLGHLYNQGRGVSQDYQQAAAWYTKAAEQGNVDAQLNLGMLFESGQGVPKNAETAAQWYAKAAELGNPQAESWIKEHQPGAYALGPALPTS